MDPATAIARCNTEIERCEELMQRDGWTEKERVGIMIGWLDWTAERERLEEARRLSSELVAQ